MILAPSLGNICKCVHLVQLKLMVACVFLFCYKCTFRNGVTAALFISRVRRPSILRIAHTLCIFWHQVHTRFCSSMYLAFHTVRAEWNAFNNLEIFADFEYIFGSASLQTILQLYGLFSGGRASCAVKVPRSQLQRSAAAVAAAAASRSLGAGPKCDVTSYTDRCWRVRRAPRAARSSYTHVRAKHIPIYYFSFNQWRIFNVSLFPGDWLLMHTCGNFTLAWIPSKYAFCFSCNINESLCYEYLHNTRMASCDSYHFWINSACRFQLNYRVKLKNTLNCAPH